MDHKIKAKILTAISNSDIDQDKKDFLMSKLENLNNSLLLKLVFAFEQDPKSISVCVDYLKSLENQSEADFVLKLEENLLSALDKLS